MLYHYKPNIQYGKYYTRKDRRASDLYKHWLHYRRRARLKPIRHDANKKLRTWKGDVGDNGWYKKFYDVKYIAF